MTGNGGAGAWLEAHKKEAGLGAAAVAVVLLGLRARSKAAGTGAGQDGMPAPTGAAVGGYAAGTLSTTGEDVYNALQPQISQTQSLMGQILDKLNGGTPTGTGNTDPTTPPPLDPGPLPKRPRPPITGGTLAYPPTVTHPPTGPNKRPGNTTRRYTVQRGDNLTKIAARYKTDWHKIYAANRSIIGSNPNLIKPGQVLAIP